jgi:hypothetical protein
LGLLAAAAGHRDLALEHLKIAGGRNPREPEVHLALRAVREGGSPDPRAAQERVLMRGK